MRDFGYRQCLLFADRGQSGPLLSRITDDLQRSPDLRTILTEYQTLPKAKDPEEVDRVMGGLAKRKDGEHVATVARF